MPAERIGTEQRPLLLSNILIKEMQYSFGHTITLQVQQTYEATVMREHALQDGFCFKNCYRIRRILNNYTDIYFTVLIYLFLEFKKEYN